MIITGSKFKLLLRATKVVSVAGLHHIFFSFCVKKFSSEVGIKFHQSFFVKLVFSTKLCIKLAVSLCAFEQFSFLANFRTADAFSS